MDLHAALSTMPYLMQYLMIHLKATLQRYTKGSRI